MDWKDTVIHLDEIDDGRMPDSYASQRKALEKQAEISFKAGKADNLRNNIHAIVSQGCRLCDYWDAENYHCMLNIPIHPAYPCKITDQIIQFMLPGS